MLYFENINVKIYPAFVQSIIRIIIFEMPVLNFCTLKSTSYKIIRIKSKSKGTNEQIEDIYTVLHSLSRLSFNGKELTAIQRLH